MNSRYKRSTANSKSYLRNEIHTYKSNNLSWRSRHNDRDADSNQKEFNSMCQSPNTHKINSNSNQLGGQFCDTFINSIPDDVLARVIIPYCALIDRISMVRTCKQIRQAIMSKRMPLGPVEQVQLRNEYMLSSIPGFITRIRVNELDLWNILRKNKKCMTQIRQLNVSIDIVNRYRSDAPQYSIESESDVCELVLPPNLAYLTFESNFAKANQQFQRGVVGWALPKTLMHLHMGWKFKQPVEGWILPDGLLSIHMGQYFNQSVRKWKLPANLTSLYMGSLFNRSVVEWKLPNKLETIHMGHKFNRSVIGWVLPNSITSITMSDEFNRPVIGWELPSSLVAIDMGVNFNKPLLGWTLPNQLTTLIFDDKFDKFESGLWILPKTLKAFTKRVKKIYYEFSTLHASAIPIRVYRISVW
jgi:hypothetical protein